MKQIFIFRKLTSSNVDLLLKRGELLRKTPSILVLGSVIQQRSSGNKTGVGCKVLGWQTGGNYTGLIRGGPPLKNYLTKEFEHKWYRWGYKPLPTQTSLDVQNPQFAVRAPEFRLPRKRGHFTRKHWRQRVAEIDLARRDPKLEKLSRDRKLLISIDDIERECREEFGLADIDNLSKFYGINSDLFGNNEIALESWLDVSFGECQIHRGNMIEPTELLNPPTDINYTFNEDGFTTMILSNLDGHPLHSSKEILHLLVSNIPGNKISEGNTIMEYMPPLPWKGSGVHRLVFALYKHTNPIPPGSIVIGDPKSLRGRTFSSIDFTTYFDMTPVGLAWCQVQWDASVSSTCSVLTDLSGEPVFDLEEYLDPRDEYRRWCREERDLMYRNM